MMHLFGGHGGRRAPGNCTLKRAAQVYIMAPCMTLATAFFREYLGTRRLICLARPVAATKLREDAGRALSAYSGQLSAWRSAVSFRTNTVSMRLISVVRSASCS